MAANPAVPRLRREAFKLRIRQEDRGLIDRAAAPAGKSTTEFVLEAARRVAEDALLDQALFVASPKTLDTFRTLLDVPLQANDKLRRMLQAPVPS